MIDLGFTAFFLGFLLIGFKRPFLWTLLYIYIDIVQPQVISWGVLSHIPTSLIAFAAAFLGWLVFDDKDGTRVSLRQGILIALLGYVALTTFTAVYATEAADKWAWVWKAMVFAIFLPFTLRTRLRIEATVLVMTLAASALIIDGGLKTVTGGSGYGSLQIFISSNFGLFEGSIISAVAIAVIPLAIWLAQHGTIFPPDWRVKLFAAALCFACALIPVGTQARTGLVCVAVLCMVYLARSRHKILIGAAMALGLVVAVPFLPQSFLDRMGTIENHQADQSASTRIAMWKWTIQYAKSHPLGGGFEIYRSSKVSYDTVEVVKVGSNTTIIRKPVEEEGRAFHSSYFEMLGEQGYPGLAIWLLLQASGLWQMEVIRRRWKKRTGPDEIWIAPLAFSLQLAHLVYLIGSCFVGIAFQAFILMLIGVQCGFWTYVRRLDQPERRASRPVHGREMSALPKIATPV